VSTVVLEQMDTAQPAAVPSSLPPAPAGKVIQVAGHEVIFPRQPYGVQIGFICTLISTLSKGQNALLEAPTGCGKTLALLCGALAWQKKIKDSQNEDEHAMAKELHRLSMPGGAMRSPVFVWVTGDGQAVNMVMHQGW
jgi:hypothetical protein